jgi:antitoxin MazE
MFHAGGKMRSRVQKWGNSLALRIPKSFANEIGLAENSSIQVMIKEGALIVTPDREPEWRLEDLLEKVTEQYPPRVGDWSARAMRHGRSGPICSPAR